MSFNIISFIRQHIGSTGNVILNKTIKHAPRILTYAGIAGFGVTIVLACKETGKAKEIIAEHKQQIKAIHENSENRETKKTIARTYLNTGLKLTRNYAPAILFGSASAFSILSAQNIMKKRNAALTAAYAALDKSYDEYRKRVSERVGETVEEEIRNGIATTESSKKKSKNDSNSEEVVENNRTFSGKYTYVFDEVNAPETCTKDANYNYRFLESRQNEANLRLSQERVLLLNDVLEMLGMRRVPEGAGVGWHYDKNDPSAHYIDFGIYNLRNRKNRDFINGFEHAIWLDFNVEGPVLEYM